MSLWLRELSLCFPESLKQKRVVHNYLIFLEFSGRSLVDLFSDFFRLILVIGGNVKIYIYTKKTYLYFLHVSMDFRSRFYISKNGTDVDQELPLHQIPNGIMVLILLDGNSEHVAHA